MRFDPPDLTQLPREEWWDALARVDHWTRVNAWCHLPEGELRDAAAEVSSEVFLEHGHEPRKPETRRATPELPTPRAGGPPDRRGVQVNVRLRPAHHALLVEAAELVGLTPTELARTFMVDGTRRLLAQRDRDPGPEP